jgi:DNA replicative helicase MCM subunit Mcm2 (Cdc46/Mcm family)
MWWIYWLYWLYYCLTYPQKWKGKKNVFQDQLLLYIRFAKNLKPKLTKEAMVRLRDEYRSLRQSDVSSQKIAYRIIVR